MMTALRLRRLSAVQEALLTWAFAFTLIVLTYAFVRGYAKLVATVAFLYLPLVFMSSREEHYSTYGVSLRNWREDLRLFLLLSAIVGPLFFVAFALFVEIVPHLPRAWQEFISPYAGQWHFRPRLPSRFFEWTIDQIFVVALPEEFFYRGFIQTRLRDAWPQGRVVLGGRLGRAFWVTAVLFALGHLAIFQAWRLAVFFPALLFGWMRERTGTVLGAALFHAAANLYMLFLEASFFGMD
jgi:uncharacterized protein